MAKQAEARKKPTKLPSRVVASDDFVVEVDGVEYRPHEGETVSFRGRMTTNDLFLAQRLRSIDMSADNVEEQLHELHVFLAARIPAWTWTDDDGVPYPSPPAPEDFGRIDFEELSWLIDNLYPKRSAEEQGEGSTPST